MLSQLKKERPGYSKCERLAAESTLRREAGLQRMRINQSERLAAESTEEREAKLQWMQEPGERR